MAGIDLSGADPWGAPSSGGGSPGIDLTGADPWGSSGGGSKIADIMGGLGSIAGLAGMGTPVGWVGLAIQAFQGKNEQTGAAGMSDGILETSGWVVGEGDAEGGKTSLTKAAAKLPWYAWAAGAIVAIAVIKKAS